MCAISTPDLRTGMTRRQLHKEAKRRAREEQRKFEEAERKARQDRLERKAVCLQKRASVL